MRLGSGGFDLGSSGLLLSLSLGLGFSFGLHLSLRLSASLSLDVTTSGGSSRSRYFGCGSWGLGGSCHLLCLSSGCCLRISLCLGLSCSESCRVNHVGILSLSGRSLLRGSGGGSRRTSISRLCLSASLLLRLSLQLIVLLLRKSRLDRLGRELAGLKVDVVPKLHKGVVAELALFEIVPQLNSVGLGGITTDKAQSKQHHRASQ